jgi:serine/threonine protein kinase
MSSSRGVSSVKGQKRKRVTQDGDVRLQSSNQIDNNDNDAAALPSTRQVTTYGRCPNVSDRYEKVGRIGEGTYGIVYKALDKESGQYVALKRCIPHHESSDGFPLTTLREIQALRLCQGHANVVKLLEVAVSKSGVFLVFEYCDNDLAQLIDAHYAKTKKSPFSLPQVKRLQYQLLSALAYLHERHMIHRDIKLSNLLYRSGSLRLADFGLARKYYPEAVLTPKVVSLWYRPPELLLGSSVYTISVDLWAAGCAFGELLQGYPLMAGQNETEQLEQIFSFLGPPPSQQLAELPLVRNGTIQLPSSSSSGRKVILDRFAHLPHAGLYILTNLLHYDPSKRWTAIQALQNTRFFDDAPLPTPIEHMPKFKTVT